jgi:hypothetical protein
MEQLLKVLIIDDCSIVHIESGISTLPDAINFCKDRKEQRFEIHQVRPILWDHYLFGEKKNNGYIDWKKVPWRRM